MHSSDSAPPPAPVGTNLLLELGHLIIRSRSCSQPRGQHERLLQAKLLNAKPSTSQVNVPVKQDEDLKAVQDDLNNHVHALWNEQIPLCIEVLLAPDCADCYSSMSRVESDSTYDRLHTQQRGLLLERWTMRALINKSHDTPTFITSQWLLNAVRSQLHFSQLSAWRDTIQVCRDDTQRRRKLSHENCNIKKLESNCDDKDLTENENAKLNIVYSIKIPGESYKMAEFAKPPTHHTFPGTDIGNNVYLKVTLDSLPRLDEIPVIKCSCQNGKPNKDINDDLIGKLNDLSISRIEPTINSNIGSSTRRLSIVSSAGSTEYVITSEKEKKNIVDDRMHTPCSENGKHKCNCDDESDSKDNHSASNNVEIEVDDKRLKELAKSKRRLRKENKLKKLNDSTSSEGDKVKETHTSIPILQAARFDRFRAIGCYRNQTYLTLPASRMETKSPFIDSANVAPVEIKKTNTIATQTDDLVCDCGNLLSVKCDLCTERGMVRSEANYNLNEASLPSDKLLCAIERCKDNGARRKFDELEDSKCDIKKCDIDISCKNEGLIKRPKLKRFMTRVDRIVNDRYTVKDDIRDLHLNNDDTVFSTLNRDAKRQKTFSINEDDFVTYEKCDYGTFDRCETESPVTVDGDGFKFPDPKKAQDGNVPSPTEMDRFRWRFDSAASMVFHTRTGLPLTSSPAPLRRGTNCFDFDDSINSVSGIKSALFLSPSAPAPRRPAPRRATTSRGLLGSFEESALKGRLEAVSTVVGFHADVGASGALVAPRRRLPVTVFFYAPGGTNAPYMGHINLGSEGYRVSRSGTIQVSLFNPHGTLVKMFVVLYDLTSMPNSARTFLRQRTLYMPAGAEAPLPQQHHKWLRYLIHLRFMTSKSGKLYLHTDIRIIVSRKSDLDTATAHSIFRPIPTNQSKDNPDSSSSTNQVSKTANNDSGSTNQNGASKPLEMKDIGYENQNSVSYELRSFTYAPDNPRYSPR